VDELRYQRGSKLTKAADSGEMLTLKIRYKQPDEDVSTLLAQAVGEGGRIRALPFAAAVAEFGMLLRDADADLTRWTSLSDRLKALPAVVDEAADRQGLAELVDLAEGLRRLSAGNDRSRR